MTNMEHSQSELPHLSTTEELIVQYLDGELVRKELETVLFERLAQSADARTLLREHLMLRGAIRSAFDDEMFQLSSDLDDRTRLRIEEMLKTVAIDTQANDDAIGIIPTPRPMLADAPLAPASPATRSLKRWALRPSLALLLLLCAVGTTYYVTRTTTLEHVQVTAQNSPATSNIPAQQQPSATLPAPQSDISTPQATTPGAPIAQNSANDDDRKIAATSTTASTSAKPQVIIKEVVKYVNVPVKSSGAHDLAQNTTPATLNAPAVKQESSAKQDASDAVEVMSSRRYAKMLNATAKREVVISSRDRL